MPLEASKCSDGDSWFYFRHGKPQLTLSRPDGSSEVMALGIDDTDSVSLGMCTTYLSAVIVEKLAAEDLGAGFIDYPHLVRLNPQVPNKTRGNGALAIHFYAAPDASQEVLRIARKAVAQHAALEDNSTHPGIALMFGEQTSPRLRSFYERCLHRIVTKSEALELAESEGILTKGLKRGFGVIGAVAALGADFMGDQTYEIIAYRNLKDYGRTRNVDEDLVLLMDREVEDTFYNYDYENRKVCVTPASPCPVYFGIRGETPQAVLQGFRILKGEKTPIAVIFRTNQHTDAHIEKIRKIASIKERSSVMVEGRVTTEPHDIAGGHVIFSITDDSGEIDCAAYEPTKQFRCVARELIRGDVIRAYGSVRPASSTHGMTINLEKIQIISAVMSKKENPRCPKCGSTLSSMGRKAGYRCRRKGCDYRNSAAEKVDVPLKRMIRKGFYEPPPVAWRHLYKPISRGTC